MVGLARAADARAEVLEPGWAGRARSFAGMLKRFANEVEVGDLVVSPDPRGRELLVGRVTGDYEYAPMAEPAGTRHRRDVRWLRIVEFDDLPHKMRRAIGAPMALFQPAAKDHLWACLESLLFAPGKGTDWPFSGE